MKRLYSLLMLILLPVELLLAQGTHLLADRSYFTIEGTSPLHDWSMKTEELQGNAALEIRAGKLAQVHHLEMKLQTRSLRSGKRLMESKAWEALKAEQYPTVSLHMRSLRSTAVNSKANQLVVEGTITIAGVTRQETLVAESTISSEGIVTLRGQKKLAMSDFQINPPSLLFGKFTADDAITINFTLVLIPNPLYTQN